ncbi:DUF6216 family protein [Duffyella gerundensis]|uniref:DUF6216 family protein n=1 Tax=Duffyella gerundensis TaxID=1619313 RepID=UPI00165467FE|nr:DUF6216 family protein [Duffyella gerundensis]
MIESHTASGIFGNLNTKDVIIILSGLTAILATLAKSLSALINMLKLPVKNHHETYLKAGLRTWPVKFFSVTVDLKTVPSLKRFELFFLCFFIIIFMSSATALTFLNWKISIIPKNWTALTLKSTKEDFIITYDKAAEYTLHPSWTISTKECNSASSDIISKDKKISNGLVNTICDIIGSSSYEQELKKSILKINKWRSSFNLLLTLATLVLIWLSISIALNIKYTKTLRKSILEEQRKAKEYLT